MAAPCRAASARPPAPSRRPPRAPGSRGIGLAHALNLNVVAEGVETSEQRDILISLGCDELQGFYFARPMPAEPPLTTLTAPGAMSGPAFRRRLDPDARGAEGPELLGADARAVVGGEDGRAVLEMIYAAYESAATGRKVVPGGRRGVAKPIDLWLASQAD